MQLSMGKILFHFWSLPEIREVDLDDANSLLVHRKIMETKPTLRLVYDRWYRDLTTGAKTNPSLASLPIVEIGCGSSFLEKYIPGVLKTDVVKHANCETVADAQNLPFADKSLRGIVMVGVFHHIEEPAKFLREVTRCLAPGGKLVMVEPSNSPLHRFMIKKFHPSEYFDSSIQEWKNGTTGRLTNANNALPWIVFCRDAKRLSKEFPDLEIKRITYHTYLLFYLSGGFSYRPFISKVFLPFLAKVENLLQKIFPKLGTMMTIEVIRK